MTVLMFPYFPWNDETVTTIDGRTAEPYTARLCTICNEWVYVADGPFAENDRTKTLADTQHYKEVHS